MRKDVCMKFEIIPGHSIPLEVLLLADPSESNIHAYLKDATCFGAFLGNELVGACVTNLNHDDDVELFNIVSLTHMQGQGVGTQLLAFVIGELKDRRVAKLVLGTGSFGHQLTFYQRLGYRVESVVKNFFIDHYDEPIYENGLQHYDMLRLTLYI